MPVEDLLQEKSNAVEALGKSGVTRPQLVDLGEAKPSSLNEILVRSESVSGLLDREQGDVTFDQLAALGKASPTALQNVLMCHKEVSALLDRKQGDVTFDQLAALGKASFDGLQKVLSCPESVSALLDRGVLFSQLSGLAIEHIGMLYNVLNEPNHAWVQQKVKENSPEERNYVQGAAEDFLATLGLPATASENLAKHLTRKEGGRLAQVSKGERQPEAGPVGWAQNVQKARGVPSYCVLM